MFGSRKFRTQKETQIAKEAVMGKFQLHLMIPGQENYTCLVFSFLFLGSYPAVL